MSDTLYRLQTESGLSEPYTLEGLRQEISNGSLDAAARCTPDEGQTWVDVSSLIGTATVQTAVAEVSDDTDSDDTDSDSDSMDADSSAADSAAPEDASGLSGDGETPSSESSNTSPDSASTASHSRTRKLKRLSKGAGDSKFAKRRADRRQKKESGQSRATKTLVGAVLAGGRYTIKSMLGKGSMAYVFLVADSRLQTDAVVKVPKPEKFTTEDFRERFKRESQLLVRFSHPHVVKVLDVGEYEKLPYVVMQLLSGGSLSDRMQNEADDKGRMSPESLKSWVREVGRALDFCFRKGMVHRDVKPANILFDEDNNPYVADFGLSKIMYGEHAELNSSETAAGIVLGTPNYISPEVVLGRAYDGRADQYSMAITIYHALTGRAPMQGNSATMTMINQTQKKLPLLSDVRPQDVSRELALAVHKGIEKRPENRFDSCEDFAEAILEGLRSPISAAPAAPIAGSDSAATAESRSSSRSQSSDSRSSGSRSSGSQNTRRAARESSGSQSGSASASGQRSSQRRSLQSTGSGARASRKGAAGSADPDLEWFGMGEDEALPPRSGQSKRPSKAKKATKTAGVLVMGQEVHPALAIALAAGVFLLIGYVLYSKLTPGPEDDVAMVVPETAVQPASVPRSGAGNAAQPKPDNDRKPGQSNRKSAAAAPKPQQQKKAAPATDKPPAVAKATTDKPPKAEPAAGPPSSPTQSPDRSGEFAKIPYAPAQGFTVGVSTCPIVISGTKVWDKSSQKVRKNLDGTYSPQGQTAVSPDGRLFAAATKPSEQQDAAVTVWDTESGSKLFTADGDSKRFVDVLLLSSDALMIGDRWSDELLVWDCETGKRRKPIKVPNVRFKQGNAAISDDGNYVAMVAGGQLGVVGAADGKPVAIMHPPDPKPRTKRVSLKAGDKPRGSRRPAPELSVPIFAALQSLRFSPNNSELAGLSTHPEPRMMSWNGMGDLNVDQAVPVPSASLQADAFQWFADRDAWLVAGNILDRSTGRVVLTTQRAAALRAGVHVYDDDHLVGVLSSAPAELSIVPIPWDAMASGLKEMQNTAAAAVGPGTQVSLQVELDPFLNRASEGTQKIQKALAAAVSREDLKVEDNQSTVFRVRIAKTANDKAAFYERQRPADQRGRSVPEDSIPDGDCAVIELMLSGEKQPVWRVNLGGVAELGLSGKDESGKAEKLIARIGELAVPYYLPKDDQGLALPVVIN